MVVGWRDSAVHGVWCGVVGIVIVWEARRRVGRKEERVGEVWFVWKGEKGGVGCLVIFGGGGTGDRGGLFGG